MGVWNEEMYCAMCFVGVENVGMNRECGECGNRLWGCE